MHVGFNHNIRYKGCLYHVQTEDCGMKKAHIVTLLYRGGTILTSKRTSYADVVDTEEAELVIEELMKVQHKEMLKGLTHGEYDHKIALASGGTEPQSPAEAEEQPVASSSAPDLDDLIFSYLTGSDTSKSEP